MDTAIEQLEKPFRSCIPDEKLVTAKEMREEGIFYWKIADSLGVAYSTLRRALNPEVRKQSREYCATHREERAQYRKNNRDRIAEYWKKYYEDHREEALEYCKEYSKTNKKEVAKRHKEYQENHREELAKYGKKYRTNNPEKGTAYCAKRWALKKGVPVGDSKEIAEIYRQAREDSGIRCYICGKLAPIGERHVDHVFPLSKDGAHALSNLAIVHVKCNLEKKDKIPDEIEIHDMSVVERARESVK